MDSIDDLGVSNSDNLTSQATGLTITGNAEPGSEVRLKSGDFDFGLTTVGVDGKFSKDISLWYTEKPFQIIAIATDKAGNVSRSDPLLISIDQSSKIKFLVLLATTV